MKTELNDRVLWFDGSSTIRAEDVDSMISSIVDFKKVHVDQITPDVMHYNTLVPREERITVKRECLIPNIKVELPEKYKQIDLMDFFMDRVCDLAPQGASDEWYVTRAQRIQNEFDTYKRHGFEWLLRLMIHVIDSLTNAGEVWGVGRGSSVSSYLLYLIGVHDIDSVFYDLDFSDFM